MSKTTSRSCSRCILAGFAAMLLGASTDLAVGAPVILTGPQDQVVAAGKPATFSVSASGIGPIKYQWYRDGTLIEGATGATLVTEGAAVGFSDSYTVVATDATGAVRSPAARRWVAPDAYAVGVHLKGTDLVMVGASYVDAQAVAAAPDGGFFAAGSLAMIDGYPRARIVKLRADGTVDPGFVPPATDAEVISALAVQPDGKLVVGGLFSEMGGEARMSLARLNPDGSLDASFNAVSAMSTAGDIHALAVHPDGRIVVSASGGSGALFMVKADGSFDRKVVSHGAFINAVAAQPDGKFIAAGYFTVWQNGRFWQNVVRFNPDGTPDATFASIVWSDTPLGLAVAADGSILVAGNVTSAGGVAVSGVARLTLNGLPDSTFTPKVMGYPGGWQVRSVMLQGEDIVIAGAFESVNGVPVNNLARLDSRGRLSPGFVAFGPDDLPRIWAATLLAKGGIAAVGQGLGPTLSMAIMEFTSNGTPLRSAHTLRGRGGPETLLRLRDGGTLMVGDFDSVDGHSTPGLARLTDEVRVDPTWTAILHPRLMPRSAMAAALLGDGRIAVGGTGIGENYVQQGGLAIFRADGSPDPSYRSRAGQIGFVRAVAVLPDGALVAAGAVLNAALERPLPVPGIMVVHPDGSPDRLFQPGQGFDGDVACLLVLADGSILVGGAFTHYQGKPCRYLARLYRDGSLDTEFAANTHFTYTVHVLAPAADGKVFAAAGWLSDEPKYFTLVRLNPDGTRDTAFSPEMIGQVQALYVQPDQRVVYRTSRNLGRLNSDGSYDNGFERGVYLPVPSTGQGAIVPRSNGQYLVADAGGVLGRLMATSRADPPVFTGVPAAQTIVPGGALTLSVTTTSVPAVSYQWYRDGASIQGATGSTYTISSFGPQHEGNYTVEATSAYGTTRSAAIPVRAPLHPAGRLGNISVRTAVGTSDEPLIVGLTIGGNGTHGLKPLLLRAVGPTLSAYQVAGALPDPTLEVFGSGGPPIAVNDDWEGDFNFASLGAFPFHGNPPRDAAVYLSRGWQSGMTMVIRGKGGAAGIVLAEAYDAELKEFTTFTRRLINASARYRVGTGDDALILGFVVLGPSGGRFVVRAIGPTLADYGVTNVLDDPVLEIRDASGVKIGENNNWWINPEVNEAAFRKVQAFALVRGSRDAAQIVTLPTGAYSVIVRGVAGATGVALAEIYELPD